MTFRARISAIMAEIIGPDAYDCTRDWSGWGYGTMGESDFSPVVEDSERMEDIAEEIITRLPECIPSLEWQEEGGTLTAVCAFGRYELWPCYFHAELLVGPQMSSVRIARLQLERGATVDALKKAAADDYRRRAMSIFAGGEDKA